MLHSDFVHLHLHTQYSLLDGACPIRELIHLAREYRMPALAITDHGNIFGAIDFYLEAVSGGVKPIIGCELYVAPGSRFQKSLAGPEGASFHLIVLAKDEQGYKNLMKLVSIGYLEGFYYKPRIDKDILSQHSKGLIGLSSCIKGELPQLILGGKEEAALKVADNFKNIFGDGNFYLELQDNSISEQRLVNDGLMRLARELNLPLVATNDVHYLAKDNAKAHEVLLCIQTQTTVSDPNRMKFQTEEFYFKSPEEMKSLFSSVPQAVSSTIEIAEKCNLELDFSRTHLPHYHPPSGLSREQFLRQLCQSGLSSRFGHKIDASIINRLEQELAAIEKSGFTSYFLIVWDFIYFARKNGIPVGPGRGSAAGSLVSYLLGITDIDPLKYGLIFERFLNPERTTLPDIDIDFCYERRNEVINYVTEKYSKQNVAQIITFGTMQARAVIRDVGRAMGFSYAEVDRIAKLVPPEPNISLKSALENEPELRSFYQNDPKIAGLIETSLTLEGLTRHASIHAAGVVISEEPLVNHVPLFKTSDGQITTAFPHTALERIGLLKMDFLGLRTLTVIDETIKLVRKTQGREIKLDNIPLDDGKTFSLLSNAETIGVFQLESSGMRDLLKKLSPEKFEDIIALLALYRPGPIGSGMVDDFIRRKHGQISIKFDHLLLEPILKDTYGILVYQEQVMRIASTLAGFSLAQADLLRRAMSKKNPLVMEEQRRVFVEGCRKNNIEQRIANKIFDLMEYFSGYGFNKSHSAAYALLSYRTAYLKANFPVEFMAALLTSEKDNTDKIVDYVSEAMRMGIKILPPCINKSFAKFTVSGKDSILFGLAAIKNVGSLAIESIVEARNKGSFSSLYDFCERVDLRLVNRKVIESLIKCGAMDVFGLYRAQLMAMVQRALEMAQGIQRDRSRGQLSFFETVGDSQAFKKGFQQVPKVREWPENQILAFEKETVGFYITGHPLARYEKTLRTYSSCSCLDLIHCQEGREVSLGGIINRLKRTTTKRKGERMAIFELEDLNGLVEVVVFPESFRQASNYIKLNAVVFVKGKVNLRDEKLKVVADEIVPIDEVQKKYTQAVLIHLFTAGLEEEMLNSLRGILSRHPGEIPVYLIFTTPFSLKFQILIGKEFYVQPTEALVKEVEGLLGNGVVSFRTKESSEKV